VLVRDEIDRRYTARAGRCKADRLVGVGVGAKSGLVSVRVAVYYSEASAVFVMGRDLLANRH
jgi:hypothetical protein